MTDTAPPVEEKAPFAVQAGDLTAKLVECREKAGLDIDQAAEELHLSVHILRALEKEDFTHLPEPPYVRGYLRGYSKLADTDARDLIRIYEALRGANPDDTAHHFAPSRPLNKVVQPAISSSTLKFIGFGALVLLLGLVSMIPGVREWATHTWSSFSAQTNPPDVPRPPSAMEAYVAEKAAQEREKEREEQQAQPPPATQQTAPQSQAPVAAASIQDAPHSDNTAGVAPTTSVSTAAATPPASTTAGNAQATTTTANTTPPANANTAANTATPPSPADAPPATADGATTTPAPAGEINVKMEFAEDVWMQVKGGDSKPLFESLNTAGSIKEFKATPPLSFKVGNAPGVKIFVNGQPFDQSPYIKGSVARFKVE
ncbi:RodZ domain-containing protein [Candidatus Thiothrix sp. Deng01]|uniref:RodZ domain-containing protein n=1 Tax=Candidatus Thiothrix phosphatis TaxID=3112415 RepID=A0ABU6CRY1_9GAMM|nr:RodZ domain-containing protein [Candidatus Thiothrix sp. Deng01]MEB4589576.1 RodZ domain-containing protein [Candidatus Thiothrix sp. Deng01]